MIAISCPRLFHVLNCWDRSQTVSKRFSSTRRLTLKKIPSKNFIYFWSKNIFKKSWGKILKNRVADRSQIYIFRHTSDKALLRKAKTKRYFVNQNLSERTKHITTKENIQFTIDTFSQYLSIVLNSLIHNSSKKNII